MNKTVYVQTNFKYEIEKKEVEIPPKKKIGFFEAALVPQAPPDVEIHEIKHYSDEEIDGIKLQEDVQRAIDQLNIEGFDVVSITPVESGHYGYYMERGWGYSYTEGVIILAKK